MNERIKQLSDIVYKNHLKNNPESSFGRRADYDKEFAELIVRECASIAGKAEYSDTWSEPVEDTIKKYFGVEE